MLKYPITIECESMVTS